MSLNEKETKHLENGVNAAVSGLEKSLQKAIDKLDDILKNDNTKSGKDIKKLLDMGVQSNSKALLKEIMGKSAGRVLNLKDLVSANDREAFVKAMYKIIITAGGGILGGTGGSIVPFIGNSIGATYGSYKAAEYADKTVDDFYNEHKYNINATIDAFSDIWDFFKNFDESIKILSEHFIKNDDKNEIKLALNIQKTDFGFEISTSKPLENDISFKIKSLNNDAKVLKESQIALKSHQKSLKIITKADKIWIEPDKKALEMGLDTFYISHKNSDFSNLQNSPLQQTPQLQNACYSKRCEESKKNLQNVNSQNSQNTLKWELSFTEKLLLKDFAHKLYGVKMPETKQRIGIDAATQCKISLF